MKPNQIIEGDIRIVAGQLPDQFVNCIVTSPPYWGLRDYGTAVWVGGNPDCDHKPGNVSRVGAASTLSGGKNHSGHLHEGYKGDCPKCRAKRIDKQIGLEPTPEAYVETMVGIFQELRRVLRNDGTLWLVLGDSYVNSPKGSIVIDNSTLGGSKTYQAIGTPPGLLDKSKATGLKPKNLVGIPWRVALALQDDGWYLRSAIIWAKPNPMPESVTDRPTKAHEYLFLLSKSEQYYYDHEVIKEPAVNSGGSKANTFKRNGSKREQPILGQSYDTHRSDRKESEWDTSTRNKRSVWTIATKPYPKAHFAVFPPDLIEPCILAGCPPDGIVFDPFFGSGTVGEVCVKTGRNWLGVELNPEYIKLAEQRIVGTQPPLIAPSGNWGMGIGDER